MKGARVAFWSYGAACFVLTCALAFCLRLLEWPSWQNPEYRLGDEMLLATHDAYHWLAGASGFGLAVDHPMAVMLRALADLSGLPMAQIAFWLPAIMASLVAGLVFLWAWALGNLSCGIAAGLIASIAPGFLGRTLLGFYDTDLVTLFFPLAISLGPAIWVRQCLVQGVPLLERAKSALKRGSLAAWKDYRAPLAPEWIIILSLSGLLSWWTQEWHSVFPYLIRYNAFILGALALCLAPKGWRATALCGALAYALPAGAGPIGLLYAALALWRKPDIMRWLARPWIVACFCLLALYLLAQGQILNTLIDQVNAYLKHSGDAHSSGGASLVFPSVAQSIIEVQDLSFTALFPYFHPWLEAALAGMAGFVLVIFWRPAALFLLPLAALGLLSSRLGGRMVMFGAPVVALGVALPCFWLLRFAFKRWLNSQLAGWLTSIILVCLLVIPFMGMIPALSQGPIINRRHAAALVQAGAITDPDATLWLWWDWGYAAHYFARRQTIADGARHGGPSLYLPAAIFATDSPRFARQVIRYASARDNEPGNFFRDLDAPEAQELINRLRSPSTPLVAGAGRQYVIASFEMLKLGFWISNYGNWNFITCQGEGGAISIVPQSVAYRLNAGEVRLAGRPGAIFPASINIFAETGVIKRDYVQEWFSQHPDATARQQEAWLASRRNINFLFNRVTDEKLAVDHGIYNSLMVQLLLCDPQDPRFAPYFRLVYDNVFARIYEVLPASGDERQDAGELASP